MAQLEGCVTFYRKKRERETRNEPTLKLGNKLYLSLPQGWQHCISFHSQ